MLGCTFFGNCIRPREVVTISPRANICLPRLHHFNIRQVCAFSGFSSRARARAWRDVDRSTTHGGKKKKKSLWTEREEEAEQITFGIMGSGTYVLSVVKPLYRYKETVSLSFSLVNRLSETLISLDRAGKSRMIFWWRQSDPYLAIRRHYLPLGIDRLCNNVCKIKQQTHQRGEMITSGR